MYKRIIHHNQAKFILGMQDWFNTWKGINVNQYVNGLKKKYVITSICTDKTDKTFDKISLPFIIKNSQ